MNQTPAPAGPSDQSNRKSNRGGARAGAGRKSLDSKIAAAVTNAFGAFPSADRWAPGRTYVYYPLTSANAEHDRQTRLEIARKALALYNASGVAVRAIDGPARAAVGIGMRPYPATSSTDFNKAVSLRFAQGPESDCRFFDAARQVNYHEACDLLVRGASLVGDMFWQKLRASDGTTRVRLIEGIFVGNEWRNESRNYDQSKWTDGAMLDELGAVKMWRVLKTPEGEKAADVPASELMQFKRTRRAGGVRGVSALAVAANHIHDVVDIVAFTKRSYKIGSEFPFAFYSERGPGVLGVIDSATDTTTGAETRTLSQRGQSGILTLRPGEKVEQLPNQLPGETFSPFMSELRREIAEGVGAPYNVLFNIGEIGGANNRWVLVEYQFLLDEIQWQLISQFCRPWYQDWIWHEIEAGYFDGIQVPDDWYAVTFGTPAKPTVDNGRDGKLLLDQIEAGFMPEDYAHGLFGRDPAEMERLRIETILRRRRLIAETNARLQPGEDPIEYDEVFAKAPASSAPPETMPHEPSNQDSTPQK